MTSSFNSYSSASDFYLRLADSLRQDDIHARYRILRNVFYHAVEQAIASTPTVFTGLFAKVDFLVKEHAIPHHDAQLIHATRKSLFSKDEAPSDEQLDDSFTHDLQATAVLIRYVLTNEDGEQEGIPEAISEHFPTTERVIAWKSVEEHSLRVIVESWDESYIYATEEVNGTELKICYSKENRYLHRNTEADWTYLPKILSQNAQLNLVRVRIINEVCMPELIIFEPDYLINITTIANCFETYAESPYVNLINKLKPSELTIPIHLGNLAGQFLDNTVHNAQTTFEEDFNDFFVHNALGLVACRDMSDPAKVRQLYADAKQQRGNIQSLIGEGLPHVLKEYDSRNVMLEPTFFSSVLGIQGRLDFLYEDEKGTVIIEQKSGKGAYVSPHSPSFDPNTPVIQEKHWVQLLLYRALFAYEFRRRDSELRHIFLLYSKYSNGLISTAQSPDLLLRAIRIRNLLAWCQQSFATEGASLLSKLTPEALNMKGVSGKLWEEWTRPAIMSVLEPIQSAFTLERAYFLRFLRFVEMEQMLAKVGNKKKECSGFASVWLDSLDDKRSAGNIYDSLSITSFESEEDSITEVSLAFPEGVTTDSSNFRIGDIVILYPYRRGETPDACSQMITRCTIVDITNGGITLRLRHKQSDIRAFNNKDYVWAVEHDMFESSSSSLFSGLHSFLSAPKERRDLLLSQRPLNIDTTQTLKGEYGKFNELVLRAKQSRDLFVVIGPPGTGKTSFGLLNILQEELCEDASNILLLSYTNRAVDEICSKLVESGITFIRLGAELSCSPEYRGNLLSAKVKDCKRGSDVRELIRQTRVFCATTASLNSNIHLLTLKHFDLAIIDESSQILEPHLIGILSAHNEGVPAIRRFVMIGDHKQLPAVVQQDAETSRVTEPELNAINLTNCRNSLFERILTSIGNNPQHVFMLTNQGRMHREIADFPNHAFYGGKLDVVPLEHQSQDIIPQESGNTIHDALTNHRVAFIDIKNTNDTMSADKVNLSEAKAIAEAVADIYETTHETFSIDKTVGVIVPYRNQISAVRNAIDEVVRKKKEQGNPLFTEKTSTLLHSITIDTVERYQGSQRDYIIYGFTVQHPYQLNFLTDSTFYDGDMLIDRKLNVAMTRARLHLLMFGNTQLLSRIPIFRELIEYCRKGSI